MASLATLFGFHAGSNSNMELPTLYPLPISRADFVRADIEFIYSKILTDVIERTDGLPEQYEPALFDNALASEHSDGLITMLAKAMAKEKDLFIVYNQKGSGVLREADSDEQRQIKDDYKQKASSETGVYISFQNYKKTKMLNVYSILEYCAIDSLNKNMNIATSIQFKMDSMRGSVALADASEVKAQAVELANALKNGKDVMVDAKDMIETAKPDLTATKTAMEFINQRRSFYLGLPASYITGLSPAGLGDSGEGETKAIERGLKNYFFSIVKPVLSQLFKINGLSWKTQDHAEVSTALQALQNFELTSDEFLSRENKTKIINKLFGLSMDQKGSGQRTQDEPEET